MIERQKLHGMKPCQTGQAQVGMPPGQVSIESMSMQNSLIASVNLALYVKKLGNKSNIFWIQLNPVCHRLKFDISHGSSPQIAKAHECARACQNACFLKWNLILDHTVLAAG